MLYFVLTCVASAQPQSGSKTDVFYEAVIAHAQRNLQRAADQYTVLLAMDPQHPAALYGLAQILVETNQPDKALPYAMRAVQAAPNNVWAVKLLASAHERNRNVGKSIQVLEAAVKKFPQELDLLFRLSDNYLSVGSEDKALAIYDTLEARTGMVEELTLRKRQLFLHSNQAEKAIAETRRLVERNPREPRYHLLLHDTYRYFNRMELAAQALEALLAVDLNNDEAILLLAEYYLGHPEHETRGMQLLTQAVNNPALPLDRKVRFLQNRLALAGNQSEARAPYTSLIDALARAHPQSASVLALRGQLNMASGTANADSAEVFLRRSLAADETNRGVWEQLITLQYRKQNWKQLRQDSEEALLMFPLHVPFHFARGTAAYYLKDYTAVRGSLERVLKFAPSDPSTLLQTHALLAEALANLKMPALADSHFRAALRLDPSHPRTLERYASSLADRNERLDEAEDYALKALKFQPDDTEVLYTYARIMYRQEQFNEAIFNLEKAKGLGGGPKVLDLLGDALYRAGRAPEAQELWRQALNAYPAAQSDQRARIQAKLDSGKIQ